jgi:haloacid dehalogenase-like hydrolase
MRDPDPLDRLRGIRGFVFDLDGTLVLGDRVGHGLRPLPGAVEITSWAARRGLPYVVFTNGTTRTPAQLAGIMREIGFGLADEAMLTPAGSAVRVFTRRGYRRVMVLGGPGLAEPLREAGLEVVPPTAAEPADAVLAAWRWPSPSEPGWAGRVPTRAFRRRGARTCGCAGWTNYWRSWKQGYERAGWEGHDDSVNRGPHVVHGGGEYDSHLLIPVAPPGEG